MCIAVWWVHRVMSGVGTGVGWVSGVMPGARMLPAVSSYTRTRYPRCPTTPSLCVHMQKRWPAHVLGWISFIGDEPPGAGLYARCFRGAGEGKISLRVISSPTLRRTMAYPWEQAG
jgi:hypothetical protein